MAALYMCASVLETWKSPFGVVLHVITQGPACCCAQVIAGATDGLIGLLLVNAPNGQGTDGMAKGLQAIANWDGGEVSCVSLSWGLNESSWAPNEIKSTEAALKVGIVCLGCLAVMRLSACRAWRGDHKARPAPAARHACAHTMPIS